MKCRQEEKECGAIFGPGVLTAAACSSASFFTPPSSDIPTRLTGLRIRGNVKEKIECVLKKLFFFECVLSLRNGGSPVNLFVHLDV